MKVTNYEISKKLSEIGFKADFDYFYDSNRSLVNYESLQWGGVTKRDIAAYELETILDALPEKILRGNQLYIEKSRIGYSEQFGEIYDFHLHFLRIENESLADTAARLLIMLWEKNLIKNNPL